jgi:hypothetical protein
MQKPHKIDYAKLLGFDALSDQISGSVDFQDENIEAKLGAKVGTEAWAVCELPSELTGDAGAD